MDVALRRLWSSETTAPGRGWLGDSVPAGRPPPRPPDRQEADALSVAVVPSLAPGLPTPALSPRVPGPHRPGGEGGSEQDPLPSTLPGLLAAAQNFLQKERASGDETAWPHPSGSGRNRACTGLSHSRKSLADSRLPLPCLQRGKGGPFLPPPLPPSLSPPPSLSSFLGLKIAGNIPLKVSPFLFLQGRQRLPPALQEILKRGREDPRPPRRPAQLGLPIQFPRAAWAPSHLLPTHLNMFRTSVLPHTSPTAPG